jgi:hypothetical protein
MGIVVGALTAVTVTALFRTTNLLAIGIYAVAATGAAIGVLRLGKSR